MTINGMDGHDDQKQSNGLDHFQGEDEFASFCNCETIKGLIDSSYSDHPFLYALIISQSYNFAPITLLFILYNAESLLQRLLIDILKYFNED